jgi:transposase
MAQRYFMACELQLWAEVGEVDRLLAAGLLQITQLQARAAQIKEARERIKVLETELARAQQASCRQAAPFRVPPAKRTLSPKRPGRPAGHPGSCRAQPEQVDSELTAALSTCPGCGAQAWGEAREIEQFIEDIPVLRPQVTRLRTYEATCGGCGQRSASRHPLQVSQAEGAAKVALGPRALALAADLNKAKGLPMRKTCAVLQSHFGLRLTPGGLSQALDRVAAKLAPQYHALTAELRTRPVLHVDETSWWVGGVLHWLWVFTHAQGTVYLVDPTRARPVLAAILGPDFAGVLVSDCLSVYDLESGEQQKCYSHHLKAISEAKKIHPTQGEGFLSELRALLHEALELGRARLAGGPGNLEPPLAERVAQLAAQAERLLANPREQAAEEAVRARLAKQRDHLFTFLRHEGVDATNNLAERQLRPAVIARKISCGNKTAAGARTFQILASLAATCAQTARDFLDLVAQGIPLNSS